jgi:hypothetical protein
MASLPTLSDGIALTHFIVAVDVERASRFSAARSFSPASRARRAREQLDHHQRRRRTHRPPIRPGGGAPSLAA